MDVAAWLNDLGLGRYADAFRDAEVTLNVLPELTDADLREIGLPLGPRKTILKAIRELAGPPAVESVRTVSRPDASTAEAERRHLTVMFVDLVGSTVLSARLDPEEMREVLRAYQSAVADEILRFGGHVAKFMGDGVLAYFGWPQAHEDDAERALRAGLHLVEAVAALSAPGPADGGREPLAARIGVATGLVVVGDLIGEGAAQEETVIGETPNLAARLQELAEPGQMVIASATRRLVGDGFEVENLGQQELKGIDAVVKAFSVAGERTMASWFEARAGPRLLPMVGRDQELALLLERWAQARAGEGQGVLLVGEAGIGKSRITRALLDSLANEPHTRIRYQCSPYHGDSAFWPVIQQLTHAADIAADDSNDTKLDRLEALLAHAVEDVAAAVPLIADLIGLDGGARYGSLDLAPQVQRTRTLAALVDQLLGLADRQPVLLVLEDAHWIDPSTLETIEQGLDRIADARVLILLTSRSDGQPAVAAHPHVTRLTLNRLGRSGVELIVARLSEEQLPAAVIDIIIAKADGVPLFVEELTKAILETGEAAIPASLHDSLMARLDRLPEVKEVAQIAACIGREFSYSLLTTITGRSQRHLEAALDRLVGAELVFRRGVPPEASYSFKHALVRDAAYESLLKSRRQRIHALIFETLQKQGVASPEILARHAEDADLLESAIRHWHRAAELAADRPAYREAASYHQHVLEVIQRLPERLELLELSVDTRLDLRNCLVPLGEPRLALQFAREAAVLAERLNDGRRRARAACYVCIMLWHVGAPHEGLVFGLEAVERASRLPDIGLEVSSRFFLGQVHHVLGNHVEASRLYEQVIATVSGERLHDRCGLPFLPSSHARAWLSLVLAELGDFDAGEQIGSEAVRIADEADQPFSLQQACWTLGSLYLRRGELSRSLTLMERAMDVTRAWHLDGWRAVVASALGTIRTLDGEIDQGVDLLEGAVRDMEKGRGSSVWLVQASISLAHAYLIAGRADDAAAYAKRALTLARERKQTGDEASALHLQGTIALRDERSDPERAGQALRQALSNARALGMRPLEADCTLGLALADDAKGDGCQAATRFRHAIEAYRELGMPAAAAEARQLARQLDLDGQAR